MNRDLEPKWRPVLLKLRHNYSLSQQLNVIHSQPSRQRLTRHILPHACVGGQKNGAGHQPWPAICNNIRAARANEIERVYGGSLESAWVGHDPKTYKRHYAQVQKSDLIRACAGANTLQHCGAGCGTGNLVTKKPHRKRQLQRAARLFRSLQMPH